MIIKSAEFVISNSDYTLCPAKPLPEYAFIGRSNVGKSSLINMVTNHSKLAHTSSTPGKTQLINHFLINKEWYLVDLPGYGWAKVSKDKKEKFATMIEDYLRHRQNLRCTFVLIDVRHEPQEIDLQFMEWLGENEIPFSIIFTKIDKLSKTAVKANVAHYQEVMLNTWEIMPHYMLTSSETKEGRTEVLNYIKNLNLIQ
jgi:GTP-binding protein